MTHPLNVEVVGTCGTLGCIMLTVSTEGLDRTDVYGWSCGSNAKLAARLKAAVEAGKALTIDGVGTDVNGKTYLRTTAQVMGRRMNADLRRLGF